MKKYSAAEKTNLCNTLTAMKLYHPVYSEVIDHMRDVINDTNGAVTKNLTREKIERMMQTLNVLEANHPTHWFNLNCIMLLLEKHSMILERRRARGRLMTIVASALWACAAITSSYLYVNHLATSEAMSFWEHGTRVIVTLFCLVMCLVTINDPSTDTEGE